MPHHVEQLREEGYAVIRGFLNKTEIAAIQQAADAVYAEGMTHHASYRDHNLLFEVLNDPGAKKRVVIQAYWFAWINAVLEAQRRSEKLLAVLNPLLGRNIKQVANQLHWKDPGGKFTFYRLHQDLRFRERPDVFTNLERNYVTTGLAVNKQGAFNGALKVIPRSHDRGYLGLSDDEKYVMVGNLDQDAQLRAAGLDPQSAIQLEMEPGDLALWTLFTVHGSGPNIDGDRRTLLINSYVRAADSPERGEWAFRDGQSTPLGKTPEICKYEQLRENPGPFYIEDDWSREAST